jgi:glycosyltransferase involved in cell wall biosynthesis
MAARSNARSGPPAQNVATETKASGSFVNVFSWNRACGSRVYALDALLNKGRPPLKVALLSGAWRPTRCGVADYTSMLADALEAAGIGVARITPGRSTPGYRHALRQIESSGAGIVHLQYPSVGFGRSLLPAFLPILARRWPVVVTLHEFSIFRWYRLPWFVGFAYLAKAVIMTSAPELHAFARRLPGSRARLKVIPIGSNIPGAPPATRINRSVCYFGLLMPGKGLEEFLAFARALREAGPSWSIRLIGAVAPGAGAYAASILREAGANGIELFLDQAPSRVAELLAETEFAYLPGPGGITERRGSVLAALQNGVHVVGPVVVDVPDWLRRRVTHAATPKAASRLMVSMAPGELDVAPVIETRWNHIAQRHADLYRALVSGAPA